MKISNTALLSGYFTYAGTPSEADGWTRVNHTPEDEALLQNFYFPEFVNFSLHLVSRYDLKLGKDVFVTLRDGSKVPLRVDGVRLFCMPCSICVYSIKVRFDNLEMDKVTGALGLLRSCCFWEMAQVGEFVDTVIAPVQKVYKALGGTAEPVGDNYTHLVENGNKLKIFQIVTSPDLPADREKRDLVLYSAATVSPLELKAPFSTDPQYYQKLMEEHRLGVFSSWTAMALLDTVTFVANEVSAFQKDIWLSDYFGKIYVYELFRKCFLYHHNQCFRVGTKSPVALQDELVGFERHYTFTAISYNFLPCDVAEAIARGLDVAKEEESLRSIVSQEVTAREEESSGNQEKFLLFLTFMAAGSAVWDITCLLDELINYEATFTIANFGYRLFSLLLLVLIIIVAWRTVRKKKK